MSESSREEVVRGSRCVEVAHQDLDDLSPEGDRGDMDGAGAMSTGGTSRTGSPRTPRHLPGFKDTHTWVARAMVDSHREAACKVPQEALASRGLSPLKRPPDPHLRRPRSPPPAGRAAPPSSPQRSAPSREGPPNRSVVNPRSPKSPARTGRPVVPEKLVSKCQGWLWRRFPGASSQDCWGQFPQWFVLWPSEIVAYSDESRKEERLSIPLKPYTQVLPFRSDIPPGDTPHFKRDRPFGFVINVPGGDGRGNQMFYLDPDDEDGFNLWMGALTDAIFLREDAHATKLPKASGRDKGVTSAKSKIVAGKGLGSGRGCAPESFRTQPALPQRADFSIPKSDMHEQVQRKLVSNITPGLEFDYGVPKTLPFGSRGRDNLDAAPALDCESYEFVDGSTNTRRQIFNRAFQFDDDIPEQPVSRRQHPVQEYDDMFENFENVRRPSTRHSLR